MKICYFGTYRSEYARNQKMIEGLRRNGVEVTECHEPLWYSIEDRVNITVGGWRYPNFWLRVVKAYFRLLKRYRNIDYDVMIVGYPGHFDVYLARILTWLKRKPLVWDILMSIYLVAVERDLDKRSPFTVAALRRIEGFSCHLPDLLILDTEEYVNWFSDTHHVASTRFKLVPIGADDRMFKPIPTTSRDHPEFKLVYYGSFIPNHGVLDITEAARLLSANQQIKFEFIGEGPERALAELKAKQDQITNITFLDWMEKEALIQHIASADICLGVFGETLQSLMTIHNKIYECLAMAKPVITGDSAPMRRYFKNGEHIYLCERGDPAALAQAIVRLYKDIDLRQKLAKAGYAHFTSHFTTEMVGKSLLDHLLGFSK